MPSTRALAAGVVAAALTLAPAMGGSGIAQAAVKPDGPALVRVSGGTAVAKETGERTYRVVVPRDAAVNWLGKVGDKGYVNGTFTQAALAKNWRALGYRPDVGVQSTITWQRDNGFVDARNARVSKLRINSAGDLVFNAKITDRQADLPRSLPGFALNVARSDEKLPRYGHQWGSPYTITSNLGYYVMASGDNSGYINFVTKDSTGAWVTCPSTTSSGATQNPTPGASGSGSKTVAFPTAISCAGANITSGSISWQGSVKPGPWSGFTFTYFYNGVCYGGYTKWSWNTGNGGSNWMP